MVERRDTGIREGRLIEGVVLVLARETGRGMYEGERVCDGTRRSERRGVEGRGWRCAAAGLVLMSSFLWFKYAVAYGLIFFGVCAMRKAYRCDVDVTFDTLGSQYSGPSFSANRRLRRYMMGHVESLCFLISTLQ